MVHEQVMVKVNAHVDRGIAPLVEAMNELPDIITAESCEGDDGKEAYVSFHVGDDDLADYVERLSLALRGEPALSDKWYTLSVEWCAGGENPLAYLRVPRQHVAAVAEAISSIAATGLHQRRPAP